MSCLHPICIMHRIVFPSLCGYEQQPEQLCGTEPSQKDRRQPTDMAALLHHGAQLCCHCSCTIDPIPLKFVLSCCCIKFGPVPCVFTCRNLPARYAGAGFKTQVNHKPLGITVVPCNVTSPYSVYLLRMQTGSRRRCMHDCQWLGCAPQLLLTNRLQPAADMQRQPLTGGVAVTAPVRRTQA